MANRKILTACGVAVVLFIILAALGNSTPKTVDAFITNYNKAIKDTVEARMEGPGKGVAIGICSINNVETAVNGSKIAVLCNELGGFGSFDNPKSFSVGFALSKDISSNNIFLILEAAIEAAGDDYNSVMKSLGVANGNRYSIPGEYNKEITFNKKKYFLTSADDMILINISIPK